MKIVFGLSLFVAVALAQPTEKLIEPFSITNRIAGGDPAEPAQFPFQVGVQTRRESEELGVYDAWCGGSLISDQIVLTAAHCLYKGVTVQIFLGGTDLGKEEPDRIIVTLPKENMIVHEEYDPTRLVNDIALVRLAEKVQLNKYIQTVNLPRLSQRNQGFAETVGWISGWGRLGDNKGSPKQLQYTRRWILTDDYCKYYFGPAYLKDTQICVDGSHGIGACSGDSGGPLTIVEEDGSRTLLGATSYGRGQCEKDYPSVYTRVTAYLDWISEKSGIKLRE